MLELACGPGGLGLAAAERVGPGGEVVLSDVAPEMTAIAAARAGALGVGNVSTRVLDLERIDEPDAAYDVVLCREGLMFAPEPARAVARDPARAAAGGRVALAVWGPREHNPWLGLVFDASARRPARRCRRPASPGPFALGDADELHRLLDGAGLADVRGRRAARAAAQRLVRRVVGADVGAGGPAVGDPRVAARAGRAGACGSVRAQPCATTRPRRVGSTSRAWR